MHRRNFPSILLYSFGLALVLSLVFNGFLLYEQNRPRSFYEYESSNSLRAVDHVDWQQQLSDCKRVNEQQDSLIRRLEQAPNAPPNQAVVVQQVSPK